jgi:hypothetical protein
MGKRGLFAGSFTIRDSDRTLERSSNPTWTVVGLVIERITPCGCACMIGCASIAGQKAVGDGSSLARLGPEQWRMVGESGIQQMQMTE